MQALLVFLDRAVQFAAWISGPFAASWDWPTTIESKSTTMQAEVKNPWQGALEKFSMTRRIRRYVNPAKTIILKCD